MKKHFKKLVSAVLAIAMMFSLVVSPAYAASGTRKCYTISSSNTTAYSNTALTTKLGTIYPTDELTVLNVTSKYTQVTYPISGGKTKTGYIPTSAILKGTSGPSKKATGSMTTYRRASTANTYGSVFKNDTVIILGTSGSFTQIKYPVSGGFKYAFVKTADANKYLSTSSTTSTASTNLSYALYKNSSAYISCGFDGYKNTAGRHEGIDIRLGNGKAVYSLTDGVVTRVTAGKTGSSGLSTIAIYYATANKTVIYLHSAPLSSITVGKTITKGQQIATESWRGCSSSSGSHTHVEVRNGKQTAACKSLNDYTLENANPTSFWNSLGYAIK